MTSITRDIRVRQRRIKALYFDVFDNKLKQNTVLGVGILSLIPYLKIFDRNQSILITSVGLNSKEYRNKSRPTRAYCIIDTIGVFIRSKFGLLYHVTNFSYSFHLSFSLFDTDVMEEVDQCHLCGVCILGITM